MIATRALPVVLEAFNAYFSGSLPHFFKFDSGALDGMSRWLASLLGVLLFTALAVFCIARESPVIVERLAAATAARLADDGYDWAEATVDGRAVAVSGTAPSEPDRDAALEAIRQVWGVRSVADRIEVRPPVFEFTAYRKGTGVVLAGSIPDERSRADIVTRAASLFGVGAVVDDLFVSSAVPDENWLPMARRGVDLLVQLDSGRVRLRNRDVVLSGVASSAQEQERIGAELLEELPIGYTSSLDIAIPDQVELSVADCAAAFETLMQRSEISFEVDSARLRPDSSPILNEVVSLVKRCPGAQIEVQGHTDSLGDAERNMDLSRQRALAVVAYVVGRGVDARRVRARGFGETEPIATNRTRRGRAMNRRIEFEVEPSR